MSIWEIKGTNRVEIPVLERWIMERFNLHIEAAVLYQILLNEKYSIKTRKHFASRLRVSEQTISRIIKKLKSLGILKIYKVRSNGNSYRTILIPLVDRAGRLPEESIVDRIEFGMYDIEHEDD